MRETSMWCSTPWRAEALALSLALWACGPASAWADPPQAPKASSPAATATASHPWLAGSRLQGEATLRYWGLRVYRARLWTLPEFRPQEAASQPLLLELHYLLDLKGQAIAERSVQEMRRAPGFAETQATQWLAQMKQLFPDVKAGDRLTGLHLPGQGVRFWHNERLLGEVPDAQFAQRFFGIWLAPSTSEADMRLALLGLDAAGQR